MNAVSQTNQQILTVFSPAKLNVFLEVLGKRADGYHELETVMLRTRWTDQLQLRVLAEPQICLRVHPATAETLRRAFPLDERNLIVKVARSLQERTGCRLGAEVTVWKRIPPESGLAGGSGNAASTIQALNQLWGLRLSASQLHSVAAEHGSDINFLLSGARAAVCRGRGELIQPIVLRERPCFVAVRPALGNSTGEVFRRTCFPAEPRSAAEVVDVLTGRDSRGLQTVCFNRLTAAACQINLPMADLLRRLPELLTRPAFMSGSGSTCFVIARSRREARRIQALLTAALQLPAWILEC